VKVSGETGEAQFRQYLKANGTSDDLVNAIVGRLSELNDEIAKDKTNLGPGFCIGHSYFCQTSGGGMADESWYREIVESEIAPLLREYWFDDPAKADSWANRLISG
jgi:5-methylcytosine-specific restriction protein B